MKICIYEDFSYFLTKRQARIMTTTANTIPATIPPMIPALSMSAGLLLVSDSSFILST